VSPWRQGNVDFERTANAVTIPAPPPPALTDPTQRQISPYIAATLLTIPRPDLTAGKAQIVDALKVGCPGYAVMRSLMMGFRALLKQSAPTTTTRTPPRTVGALHRWMARARASGIAMIQHFESRLQGDILAVEAAVTERWSNGPVEGQVNRLQTIKRRCTAGPAWNSCALGSFRCRRNADRLATGRSQNPKDASEPFLWANNHLGFTQVVPKRTKVANFFAWENFFG